MRFAVRRGRPVLPAGDRAVGFPVLHAIRSGDRLPDLPAGGVGKTADFILTLALVFGLAFQTPVAIVFAERMGLVALESLSKARRYVFLGAFVVGAVLTPPDVVSQVALALPLYVLYEGGLLACRLLWRKRNGKSGS